MPTLEDNHRFWGRDYDWAQGGDEWSGVWGGAEMQWFGTLLPRIHQFLPTGTILEIAPGFGRWTQFLAGLCRHMIVVDMSDKCIDACKQRFRGQAHIRYHVNDGKSLDAIDDSSIDFVFSFDSLVHAEADVVGAYLAQLERKLRPGGVGFIHHSNLGEFSRFYATYSAISKYPRLNSFLQRIGLLAVPHWRAPSMTSAKFQTFAEQSGLRCLSQEKINWGGRRTIDCLTVFTKDTQPQRSHNPVLNNPHFMGEAQYLSKLARLYGAPAARGGAP